MKRIAATVVLLLISGCRVPVAPEQAIALSDYPKEQVLRGDEWRWARRIDGGGAKTVELGVPEMANGCVRLGILPRDASEKTMKVEVFAGEEEVASFRLSGPIAWIDRRVELGARGKGRPCRVRFSSERDFMVSDCFLVDKPAKYPNVIIALIDALRPDHLGTYGYRRPTSPNIDSLAEKAMRFDNCIAQSSWTRPSVATLLTGCYPSTHGAIDRDSLVQPNLPTLGACLSTNGYETHAYIGNIMCLPVWGMANEFDRVLYASPPEVGKIGDDIIIDEALAALDRVQGRPFFFYLHLLGTHTPYASRDKYNRMFGGTGLTGMEENAPAEDLINCYDAELAFSDVQIGRLAGRLRELDLYENTILIVTADHGEQFYEHGEFGHGMSLYNEEVQIPLIIKPAGSSAAGSVCDEVVELIDLAPTLLDLLDLPGEPRFQGQSFARVFRGAELEPGSAYSSLHLEKRSAYMAQNGNTKFIHDMVNGREMWFDLQQDPLEHHPLERAAQLPGSAQLLSYAGSIAALESHGLNLLITTGGGLIETVTGSLRGSGVKMAGDGVLSDFCKVTKEDGGLAFVADFAARRHMRPGSGQWHEAVQQESARMRFAEVTGKEILIDLKADGQPVRAEDIFLGPPGAPRHPRDDVVLISDLTADSYAFDPLLLERRFAVYVWYVPPPETVSDEQLDPEVRKAMEALGYLE